MMSMGKYMGSVLLMAAQSGDIETVRRILLVVSKTRDMENLVKAKNEKKETALIVAANHGNLEVVHALLVHAIDDQVDQKVLKFLAEKGLQIDQVLKASVNNFKVKQEIQTYMNNKAYTEGVKQEVRSIFSARSFPTALVGIVNEYVDEEHPAQVL